MKNCFVLAIQADQNGAVIGEAFGFEGDEIVETAAEAVAAVKTAGWTPWADDTAVYLDPEEAAVYDLPTSHGAFVVYVQEDEFGE